MSKVFKIYVSHVVRTLELGSAATLHFSWALSNFSENFPNNVARLNSKVSTLGYFWNDIQQDLYKKFARHLANLQVGDFIYLTFSDKQGFLTMLSVTVKASSNLI